MKKLKALKVNLISELETISWAPCIRLVTVPLRMTAWNTYIKFLDKAQLFSPIGSAGWSLIPLLLAYPYLGHYFTAGLMNPVMVLTISVNTLFLITLGVLPQALRSFRDYAASECDVASLLAPGKALLLFLLLMIVIFGQYTVSLISLIGWQLIEFGLVSAVAQVLQTMVFMNLGIVFGSLTRTFQQECKEFAEGGEKSDHGAALHLLEKFQVS